MKPKAHISRTVPLTRHVLEGISQALTDSEAMMSADMETYEADGAEWKAHEAALRWFNSVLAKRGLTREPAEPLYVSPVLAKEIAEDL